MLGGNIHVDVGIISLYRENYPIKRTINWDKDASWLIFVDRIHDGWSFHGGNFNDLWHERLGLAYDKVSVAVLK